MKKKGIMILGAGPMQVRALRTAREMGLLVIAADRNPCAKGFSVADVSVPIDIRNHVALSDWAERHRAKYRISAVFAGADVAVTAAAINERLGLPGVSMEVAVASHNKALMKQRWESDGVPTPHAVEVKNDLEAENAAREIGFPLIVKATDNSASRGARVIERAGDFLSSVEQAMSYSTTGSCLIEELVIGEEQSVDTIMHKGQQIRGGIVDRHFGFFPYPIETGHTNPTQLALEVQDSIYRVVDCAARSLGILDGPAKADMILTKKGPMILEMPARLSGGFHSQFTTWLATGMHPIRAAMRQSLGDPGFASDLQVTINRFSACHAIFPPPGRVRGIHGYEKARSVPGVHKTFLFKKVGETIADYRNCADRPCYVIASAASRDKLQSIFDEVGELLKFDMEVVG